MIDITYKKIKDYEKYGFDNLCVIDEDCVICKDLKDAQKLKKKYDLVFFASVTKAKGVEDLIKVTALLKKKFPTIRAEARHTKTRVFNKLVPIEVFSKLASTSFKFNSSLASFSTLGAS